MSDVRSGPWVGRCSGRAWRSRVAVAIGVCLVVSGGAMAQSVTLDRIMAIVEGRAILQSDVVAAIELELEPIGAAADPWQAMLERLVDRELILAEVERYVREAARPAIVAARVQVVRDRYDSAEAFEATLERLGLGLAQLRARIRDDLRIEIYLDQRFGATARPTDEAILQYYREHRAEFVRSDRTVSLAEAEPLIRERLATEQRRTLIAEWTRELRRRGTVILPGSGLP